MYQARKASRSEFVPVRTLRYHVRHWGQPRLGQPPLVLVHGWMDVSASWQFVVDAMAQDRWVLAPDWRGYGLTGAPDDRDGDSAARAWDRHADNYWFPDYLADLDILLDHYVGEGQADLVGHSMGGNIAMMYAGTRPQRIRRLVNLEGFGMARTEPAQAPQRYARWIDEVKSGHRGELAMASYATLEGVAGRLMKTNRRLPGDKAQWLARHWARQEADGRWHILGHAAHKIINANLYQVPEALALYAAITAPVLSVEASDDSLESWNKGRYTLAEYHERLAAVRDCRIAVVQDAGHMLHHDQPGDIAALIEQFTAVEAQP